jgi:sodium transport system permease protein
MRLHIVWSIFRKEITEALRDRLTLIVVLALPILIYPLVVTSLARIARTQEEVEDKRVSQVVIWGEPVPSLVAFLEKTNTMKVQVEREIPQKLRRAIETGAVDTNEKARRDGATNSISSGAREELHKTVRAALAQNKADAALVILPGMREALDRHDRARVMIYYDSIRPASAKALERLEDELARYRRQLVEDRQRERNLPKGFSTALEIRAASVATPQNEFGDRFGRLLPLLLIMLSATGALYAAVDLTAGEKDRATMQTLLVAPVMPLEIVAGKFLTVWTVSLVSALANITSLGFTFMRVAASANIPSLPIWALMVVLGLLALVTCTVAAAFIGVAALARDAKDAGNFLSATLIILTMPVAASIMPGVELNHYTAFVPLVNISLLIKSVFLEGLSADILFLTVVASFGYAVLALVFAARVFGREEILLGGSVSWRQILPGQPRRIPEPTPGLVIAFFVVVLVIGFYGSLLAEKRSIPVSIAMVQYGFFLLPTIGLVALKRFPFAKTFSLRRPNLRSVIGAVLIGCSAGAAVAGITVRILPPPDSLKEGIKHVLMLGSEQPSLWLALLLFSVTPALCEEALFRGLTLSGLRRLGPWAAICISALMFGVAHASIYRLIPTFLIGLGLGYVAWRSGSIFCSMIVHALNNGLIILLLYKGSDWFNISLDDMDTVPVSWAAGALVVTGIGLWLISPRKNGIQESTK